VKRAVVAVSLFALVFTVNASAARISAAERRAIDRTLDGFVNHALKRQKVDAAWNLVTPNLKAGTSRSSWDAGNVPVAPYQVTGTKFHDWTVDSATPTQVDFELLVPSKSNSTQFYGTVKKLNGRWLIDSFNPSATFGGGAVTGPQDFLPQSGGDGSGVARLGSTWVAIPVVLFGGGILCVFGFLVFVWVRNRRAYRREKVRPLDPFVVRRRDSEPALVPKEGSETDG
jgi:hypothetical protein